MIKGVVFDLDGTLIDSMKVWSEADRAFLIEHGVEDPPPEISDKVRRMSVEESSEFFISEFGLKCTVSDVITRIEELVRIQYEEKIQLKPYVMELLDHLDRKGIPYGVATATYRSLAAAVLKRHGLLDRMKFLLTDMDFPQGKTDPGIFLAGAKLLGLEPAETMVVEDSLHCIETASAAGFFTVGVYDDISARDRVEIERLSSLYVEGLDGIITFKDWE